MYLLGIDIGTSACKVAIFDQAGKVIATANGDYPVYYPQAGWVEQNPTEWWSAVASATQAVIAKSGINPNDISGVGIDGQSWSAIALDKSGKVLGNNPIWMDNRSEQICLETEARIGAENIFNLSGNSLKAPYTTGKILWYKQHMPDLYAQIATVLQSNSYIAYCLTGAITQEVSQGYGLHCFNMRTMQWDENMAKELGIPMSFLPDICRSHDVVGKVTAQAAAATGIPEGTPVVAGGLDAACGTLGVGVIHDGQTQEQGGQAGGMSICTKTYSADPALILSPHVTSDSWLLQGGTVGGGGALRWFEREFGAAERASGAACGKNSFEMLSAAAESIAAGSDGVVFLPYMSGERSPIWDVQAKGVYYGLDFSKTRAHMARATMEGVAFSLRHNLDVAAAAGSKVDTLRAMGGAANSLVWTQLKADITQKRIEVPASDTASTLGAALLAGVGVGMYKNFDEAVAQTVAVNRVHEPNVDLYGVYDAQYETYLALYENLKGIMHK